MFHQRIDLPTEGAYLETYFPDCSDRLRNSGSRPVILICPGGGYGYTTDREAEPLALAFASRGYHAAVLRYPCAPVRYPKALMSLGQAVLWLRAHAEEYHMDGQKLCVSGFSAGGHLAASLCVFWHRGFLTELLGCAAEDIRPQALLLGYPVITDGDKGDYYTLRNLLGAEAAAEEVAFQCLENHVTDKTPPTFLWSTDTDELVPIRNSLVFSAALNRAGVSQEVHIYSVGEHGLSLSNAVTEDTLPGKARVNDDCTGWVDMAQRWLKRQFGV
jgi:acetyl esterase/lipase